MFSFRKSSPRSANVDSGNVSLADAEEEVLCLEPHQVVQGIRYHILEGNVARFVSSASCARAESRLVQRGGRLTVLRDCWEQMTDAQRLRWLLEHSHISFNVGPDGLAVLVERA